jgi:hypothetical protein
MALAICFSGIETAMAGISLQKLKLLTARKKQAPESAACLMMPSPGR